LGGSGEIGMNVNLYGADADVAGSDTTDQAAGPTNDDRIDTFAAIAGGAGYFKALWQRRNGLFIFLNVATVLIIPA